MTWSTSPKKFDQSYRSTSPKEFNQCNKSTLYKNSIKITG